MVPKVTEVFLKFDQELPVMTRLLLALSSFIASYGLYLVILLVIAITGFLLGLRNEGFRAAWHRILLRLPGLGPMLSGAQGARFARTMAISTAASVPVLDAIRISAQVVTLLPIRKALNEVLARVREGAALSAALRETGQFPKLLVRLTASGEKSGSLEPMLDHSAELIEKQVESRLAAFLALLEPGMILLMGLVVLGIVMAILQPIFELNTLLGGG